MCVSSFKDSDRGYPFCGGFSPRRPEFPHRASDQSRGAGRGGGLARGDMEANPAEGGYVCYSLGESERSEINSPQIQRAPSRLQAAGLGSAEHRALLSVERDKQLFFCAAMQRDYDDGCFLSDMHSLMDVICCSKITAFFSF